MLFYITSVLLKCIVLLQISHFKDISNLMLHILCPTSDINLTAVPCLFRK
jgi:hypothetical protein